MTARARSQLNFCWCEGEGEVINGFFAKWIENNLNYIHFSWAAPSKLCRLRLSRARARVRIPAFVPQHLRSSECSFRSQQNRWSAPRCWGLPPSQAIWPRSTRFYTSWLSATVPRLRTVTGQQLCHPHAVVHTRATPGSPSLLKLFRKKRTET